MAEIAIIGAGPAGLIAAETLGGLGHQVTLYDHMPTPGRKFLLAGRGGLNLTHSEPLDAFLIRYGTRCAWMAASLSAFTPNDLRAWCEGLGQGVFVGSSGRVFPNGFKAAPLLRAWLRRLDSYGVKFKPLHRWTGFSGAGGSHFAASPDIRPQATVLALGGASWPRMGSDGGWVPILRAAGISVADLKPSNCGIRIPWSAVFLGRFEGEPLKRIALSGGGRMTRGEAVITSYGLEGGAVYALLSALRNRLEQTGAVTLHIDLRPDIAMADLATRLDGPRQAQSLSNFLRRQAGLSPVAIGLVQEAIHAGTGLNSLAALVKAIPLQVTGMQPIARAISSAGGICIDELDDRLMLKRLPGVFVAGEMLDWDAPTGGYLLQACFSTGTQAARGIHAWLTCQ